MLALVNLQEEIRELLYELVLGFWLSGSGYSIKCLLKFILEGLTKVRIDGIVAISAVFLVNIENCICASRLRSKDAVKTFVSLIQLSIVEDFDIAKAEPVTRKTCSRLTNTDSQRSICNFAEHIVRITSCLESIATADNALHCVACKLAIFVIHFEVGNRTIDVAVFSIDGIFGTNHIFYVGLEEVMYAVSIKCCCIIGVVIVIVWSWAESTIYLQLIDTIGKSGHSLVHIHLGNEAFCCIKRTCFRSAPACRKLSFPTIEVVTQVSIGEEHSNVCSYSRSGCNSFCQLRIDEGSFCKDFLFAEFAIIKDIGNRAVGIIFCRSIVVSQIRPQKVGLFIIQIWVFFQIGLNFFHFSYVCGIGCSTTFDALALTGEFVVTCEEVLYGGSRTQVVECLKVRLYETLLSYCRFITLCLFFNNS